MCECITSRAKQPTLHLSRRTSHVRLLLPRILLSLILVANLKQQQQPHHIRFAVPLCSSRKRSKDLSHPELRRSSADIVTVLRQSGVGTRTNSQAKYDETPKRAKQSANLGSKRSPATKPAPPPSPVPGSPERLHPFSLVGLLKRCQQPKGEAILVIGDEDEDKCGGDRMIGWRAGRRRRLLKLRDGIIYDA